MASAPRFADLGVPRYRFTVFCCSLSRICPLWKEIVWMLPTTCMSLNCSIFNNYPPECFLKAMISRNISSINNRLNFQNSVFWKVNLKDSLDFTFWSAYNIPSSKWYILSALCPKWFRLELQAVMFSWCFSFRSGGLVRTQGWYPRCHEWACQFWPSTWSVGDRLALALASGVCQPILLSILSSFLRLVKGSPLVF